jgi:predicted nucleic-acid-binding Zn-ribbon protein
LFSQPAALTAAFSLLTVNQALAGKKSTLSQTNFKGGMTRNLLWVEEQRFCGFACSECSWRFYSSAVPTGKSFDEMMRNFELQRDKEFASHVCADHSKTAASKHSI